jgi:hypothetical protein
MKVLIDSDAIVWKIGTTTQKKVWTIINPDGSSLERMGGGYKGILKEFGEDILSPADEKDFRWEVDSEDSVDMRLRVYIRDLKKHLQGRTLQHYLTDYNTPNYRYAIAKTQGYKAHRENMEKPKHFDFIRNWIIEKYGAIMVPGIEADDALGMAQIEVLEANNKSIIAHIDKDINQIPGGHFNLDTHEFYEIKDPGYVRLEGSVGKRKIVGGGQLWFCAQLLMGDSADNIPGLYKYGPVEAFKQLQGVTSYEHGIKIVWENYKYSLREELTEDKIRDRLFEVSQLLWIKRHAKEKIFLKEWLI